MGIGKLQIQLTEAAPAMFSEVPCSSLAGGRGQWAPHGGGNQISRNLLGETSGFSPGLHLLAVCDLRHLSKPLRLV